MGVLRGCFGPSKKEIWRQLSEQIGGEYVEATFWKGDKVRASHDQWTVTLDTLDQLCQIGAAYEGAVDMKQF
jgi:hypothetical protein